MLKSTEDLLRSTLRKLNRARLLDECRDRLPKPKGKPWTKLGKEGLVDALIAGVDEHPLRLLAAEAEAWVRPPPFNGFIWRFSPQTSTEPVADQPANRTILDRLAELNGTSVADLVDLRVHPLPAPEGSDSVFAEIAFRVLEPRFTIEGEIANFEERRVVRLAIDQPAEVLTVFASVQEHAAILGDRIARGLGIDLTALNLTDIAVPRVKGGRFSSSALQVLEAVYGRFQEVGNVTHAPTLWTRPTRAGAVATEQATRGDADMLTDPDVCEDLVRAYQILGIRVFLRYQEEGASSPMILSVTLRTDDELGLNLQVARGSYAPERVMRLYELLRNLLMRGEPSSGTAMSATLEKIEYIASGGA